MATPRIRTVSDNSITVLTNDCQIIGNFDTREQAIAHVSALGHSCFIDENFDSETEFTIQRYN